MIRWENQWLVCLTGTSSYNCIVVQLLSHVQLLEIPWNAACQASLSITISQSLLKLSQWCHPIISSSVIPFSSRPQSFPASGSFPMNQLFPSGGQSIESSASASVLPMNIQGWFPLGWTGWISLQSKGLSRVFFSTTVQKHQFFSLLYGPTLTSVIDYRKSFPLSWKLLVDKGCASLLSHCSPSATQSTVHSLIS